MGTSGSTPDVTRQELRSFFAQLDEPSRPVTAAGVAEKLECSRQTAQHALDDLAESGSLQSTELREGARVWWRSEDATRSPDGQSDPEEFRAFVRAVEDYAIFMLDPDGAVVSWNDGAERIKGYREAAIVGQHFSTFYTDDDRVEGEGGDE